MQHKHIVVSDKTRCSGCSACSSVCPKQCITLREDAMGSKYPEVDTTTCIECGACVKVCPFINPATPATPLKCFAAVNKNNDVRIKSSSGGIFNALARQVVLGGGDIFGAAFNKDWMVEHVSTDNMSGVKRMMGSKYVQSDTLATFNEAKKLLMAGRKVLYSGTPCQIAGLNHFLRKDYPNLITVEVICHGAPERGVWRNYLKEITARPTWERVGKIRFCPPRKGEEAVISDISFRDKRNGWKKFGFALLEKFIIRTFSGKLIHERILEKLILASVMLRLSGQKRPKPCRPHNRRLLGYRKHRHNARR